MKTRLLKYLFAVALVWAACALSAFAQQTPAAGTATFAYQNTSNQAVSNSGYAIYVPNGASADAGQGYAFVTQGTADAAGGPYLQIGFYVYAVNSGVNDAMVAFNRSATGVTVQTAYIMSAGAGVVTSQTATSLPVAGGKFKLNSLDFESITASANISIQAYRNGVAIGSPVTGTTIPTTGKTTITLSGNTNFNNIDEIAITGINADGIRVDNINTGTAVVASPPVISYTSQVYTVGTKITPLSPNNTGTAVGAYATPATFASVSGPADVAVDASGNVYATYGFSPNGNLSAFNAAGGGLTTKYPTSGYNGPQGIVFDALGNMYVANYSGNTVTRITVGGAVTTISGFSSPTGLAVDASNNVFVTNYATGVISEIAAGATTATTYTTGFTANSLWGIAVNTNGDIYVSQTSNSTIYKIPSGSPATHTSFISTGLNTPRMLIFDSTGNLYVSDLNNNAIKQITTAGVVTTLVTSGLNQADGEAIDASGNLYISNFGTNTVLKAAPSGYTISPGLPAGLTLNAYTGTITGTPTATSPITSYTVTATGTNGSTATATFNLTVTFPLPVIAYPSSPYVYTQNIAISPTTPTNSGGAVGSYGAVSVFVGASPGHKSNGIFASQSTGYIYFTSVTNFSNTADNSTYIYNAAGASVFTQTGSPYNYNGPAGIVVDAAGTTYVANRGAGTIVKTTSANAVTTITGFTSPTGLAIDASGNIYVADNGNGNIYKINSSSTTAGTAIVTGFTSPWGIAVNTSGDLFISSNTSNIIYKVPSGSSTASTFVPASSGISSPRDMIFDAGGNLYEADANTNSINRISSSGVVTPVITGLFSPIDEAFDAQGDMFISDYNSAIIYKSVPTGYTISPTLPAGLIFNTYTGTISGTPTVLQAATNYTVTATNAGGSATTTISIAVIPATPTITVAGNPGCGSGSVTLTATGGSPAGGTYNWYNTATGSSISAVTPFAPITSGTYYLSYTVSGVTSAQASTTITINPIVSSPYTGAVFSYSYSGNLNDVSGNNNTAIAVAAPTATADRYGATASAYTFNGTSQYMYNTTSSASLTTFTISIWFNTTTTNGGRLIGFGASQTGLSFTEDRHLYMSTSGQLYMGIYDSGDLAIFTPNSYNDGNWHHVIVTESPAHGTILYVDGTLQAQSSTLVPTVSYTGYWRIGYDNISGYPNAPSNYYFAGTMDDVAVYSTEFTAAQVTSSNNLNQIGNPVSACVGTPITFYAPTITGATYTWKDPTSTTTVVGNSATFTSAVAGNYTLTVTNGPGSCSSTATVPATVNSPSTTFTATSAVLVGNNATVTYTGTDPNTSTYAWNFDYPSGTSATVLSGTNPGQGPFQVQWSTPGTKTIQLTVTNAAGCVASSTQTVTVTAASAWYSTYVYREKITLSKSQVSGSTDLNNFPVLIKVVDANLIYTAGKCTNKLQSSLLADLAFTDGTSGQTAELYYDIDTYDPATGTLWVWVQVPTLAASGTSTPATSINMYYGDNTPPVTHNTAFYQKTWQGATSSSVNYNSVYHFNQAVSSSTNSMLDATSNGVNLIASNTALVSNITSTQIGSGVKFSATTAVGGNLTATGITSYPVNGTSPISFSCWLYYPNTPGSGGTGATQNALVLGGPNASGNAILVQLGFTNSEVEVWPYGGRGVSYDYAYSIGPTPSTPTSSVWHYYAYTFNGTTQALYIDGVAQTSNTLNPTSQAANKYNQIEFGDYPGDGANSEEYDGNIDEAHFIATALSSDWVKTEYNNQLNPTNSGTTPFISNIANIEYNTTNYSAGYSPGSLMYTWTGTGGVSVTTASNWNITSITPNVTAQAPLSYASISIPSSTTYPTLSASFNIYSLTLASGALINLNGNTLVIGCDIINNGGGKILYNNNMSSSITWSGSLASQNYYGSTTSGTGQTGSMTINNSAGGTVNILSGALDIYNTLTLTKGTLAVGASPAVLTLKSSASQTAAVMPIATGSAVTGNVNVERYFQPQATIGSPAVADNTRGYRLLSSPVNNGSGAGSLTYLSTALAGLYTAGPTGNAGGFTVTNATPTMYLYMENQAPSTRTFSGGPFKGLTNISSSTLVYYTGSTSATSTTTLPPGNGVFLYYLGNNINNLTSGPPATAYNKQYRYSGSYVAVDASTPTATGTLNQGSIPVKLWWNSSTTLSIVQSGYNLVGNPYAASIDWDKLNDAANDIVAVNTNNTVYVYNFLNRNYGTYQSGVAVNGGSHLIASGQGFFVKATGSGSSLTFNEGAKVATQLSTSGSPLLLLSLSPNNTSGKDVIKPSSQKQLLQIRLANDSINNDNVAILFEPGAKNEYEPALDADRLGGFSNISTLASYGSGSEVPLSINHMHSIDSTTRIKLYVDVSNTQGIIDTLSGTGFETLDPRYDVYLIDHYKKDSLLFSQYKKYLFNIYAADTSSYGFNRFELVFHKNIKSDGLRLLSFTDTVLKGGVLLSWTTSNESDFTGFQVQRADGSKKFIPIDSLQSNGSGSYSYLDTSPLNGTSFYRLLLNNAFGQIIYSDTLTVHINNNGNKGIDPISIYPNPASTVLNIKINSYTPAAISLKITNSIGQTMVNRATSGNNIQQSVKSLLPGTYVIQITDSGNQEIIGIQTFIKL